jgi:hypothetical protein
MKIKSSELTRAALDWAVASYADKHVSLSDIHWGNYSPSTDWAQGGPIIEREIISVQASYKGYWSARILVNLDEYDEPSVSYGPTPLIAAMRCYVASKFGDVVDVPDELK